MPTTEPEGASPSAITNHAFEPDADGWWTLCAVCGLAESAHVYTTVCQVCGGKGWVGAPDTDGNYDPCDTCEGIGTVPR